MGCQFWGYPCVPDSSLALKVEAGSLDPSWLLAPSLSPEPSEAVRMGGEWRGRKGREEEGKEREERGGWGGEGKNLKGPYLEAETLGLQNPGNWASGLVGPG